MCSRLDTISACDIQTDGQADRRTPHDGKDRATYMQSVARITRSSAVADKPARRLVVLRSK